MVHISHVTLQMDPLGPMFCAASSWGHLQNHQPLTVSPGELLQSWPGRLDINYSLASSTLPHSSQREPIKSTFLARDTGRCALSNNYFLALVEFLSHKPWLTSNSTLTVAGLSRNVLIQRTNWSVIICKLSIENLFIVTYYK